MSNGYGGTVTDVSGELLSGLPEGVRRLLSASPVTEKKLLELGVAWTGLPSEQAWMAERLRLFVITWDPLEWLAGRPDGFATVNAGPSGFELVVYAPVWSVVEEAVKQGATVVAVLAAMAGSAVVTAAAGHRGSVTSDGGPGTHQTSPDDLLSDRAAGAALGLPDVRLVSPGWEDIGRHRLVRTPQRHLHVAGHRPGHQQRVSVPRRCVKNSGCLMVEFRREPEHQERRGRALGA